MQHAFAQGFFSKDTLLKKNGVFIFILRFVRNFVSNQLEKLFLVVKRCVFGISEDLG